MATTPKMTREQFIAKYALGPGGTFLADDKGGNAASEVAGQDVGSYYDRYLAPGAKGDSYRDYINGDGSEQYSMPSFGWKYRDAYPNFDAWDNVNPHPVSQDLGPMGEAWRQIGRPVATAAAMYYGGQLLSGAGAAAGTGTAGGGALGAGAEGLAAGGGMSLAEQYAAYGAGGGGVTGGLSTGTVGGFTGAAGGDLVGTAAGLADATTAGGSAAALGGNADKAALLQGTGYGEMASPAELAAASGMPMNQLVAKFGPQLAKLAMAAVASKVANDGGSTGGSSANVDSLVSSAFGNTKSMENDYNNVFKPWANDQVSKITARGDAGYDTLTGLASAPNKNLAAYQTYVDRVGTQGYRDQQRDQAIADVQQQTDIGLGSARRAAMARGVDPSKFALQANANSINTAAAKVKAASDAETNAWDRFGKGSQTASAMQIADSNNRGNLVTGANNLGLSGFNAGTKLATVDGAYRGGLTNQYNGTLGAVTGSNNSANQQSNYDKEHGLSGVLNAGIATAATKWLTDTGTNAVSNIFK